MKKLLSSPFFVFSLIFVLVLFFLPPRDTDLGWHLRYGQYFFQTGQILKQNLLTFYLPDYIWPNSYGFYQILITFIFNHLGLSGLAVLSSVFRKTCPGGRMKILLEKQESDGQ